MKIVLDNLEKTSALAQAMARHAQEATPVPVLMRGQLGAGKTTFVRELVTCLPGSEEAEVSSPSFNLLNIYPTTPRVAHFDLYRGAGQDFGVDLEEILLDPAYFCLVEWADFLPATSLPDAYIQMEWSVDKESRTVQLNAHGEPAAAMLAALARRWEKA